MKHHIRISYAAAVYGQPEITAAIRVLKNPSKIVAGPAVKKFKEKIAFLFGKKYGVMVNSGSSANLVAIEALNLQPHHEKWIFGGFPPGNGNKARGTARRNF